MELLNMQIRVRSAVRPPPARPLSEGLIRSDMMRLLRAGGRVVEGARTRRRGEGGAEKVKELAQPQVDTAVEQAPLQQLRERLGPPVGGRQVRPSAPAPHASQRRASSQRERRR
eukprot:3487620-Rhodomonas_salina.1